MGKAESVTTQVSPFMVFFLVHAMQVGVGVLGVQRMISKYSGYDGWISIIIAGIIIAVIICMIYYLLDEENRDIMELHKNLFGKWIGNSLSYIMIIYFYLLGLVVLRTFIEVVQVWVFSELRGWVFGLLTVSVLYYLILGGFRAVTGLCFVGVFVPAMLYFVLLLPLEYANFYNLLPVWKHSLSEMLLGARESTLSFLGFELILMFYPFIKNAEKSLKWALAGHGATTIVYTSVMIISLVFYSEKQLEQTIWPTLTLLKVIELPFIERFEYLGISLWFIIIIPNLAMAFWAASRGLKKLLPFKQRSNLLVLMILVVCILPFMNSRMVIDMFNTAISNAGFIIITCYIPLLFLIKLIVHYVKKKGSKK
ncbi:GerAB/ArcD/ProY family transporter [Alteribacillus sp. HJP-4]|uniref:GerAB/ArcD/ProY family transporter n=1 Tax=Alteribacillus sp. HJP-4 TaxID=2775394 RepID=UPI0035CD08BE